MIRYSLYGTSIQQQKKAKRYFRRFMLALLILILLGVGVFIVDNTFNGQQDAIDSAAVTQSFSPRRRIHELDTFSFETDETWRQIEGESTPGKHVFRSYRGPLVQREFVVYTGELPEKLLVSRTLPVKVEQATLIPVPDNVTRHCREAVPVNAPRVSTLVSIEGVTFTCNPDMSTYTVIVGEQGGNTILTMVAESGSPRSYKLVYHDYTASPDSSPLRDIIQSFRAK